MSQISELKKLLDRVEVAFKAFQDEHPSIKVKTQAGKVLDALSSAQTKITSAAEGFIAERGTWQGKVSVLEKRIRLRIVPHLGGEAQVAADALAQKLQENKAVLAAALAATSEKANKLSSSLHKTSEETGRFSLLTDLSASDRVVVLYLQKEMVLARAFGVMATDGQQLPNLMRDIVSGINDLAEMVPDPQEARKLFTAGQDFNNALGGLTAIGLQILIDELLVQAGALAQVNQELAEEYKRIRNFEAGAARCVATLKFIGKVLTFLSVL